MFNLSFIDEKLFKKHVYDTIIKYNKSLEAIDLRAFNSNIIDPIKLLFDKSIYGTDFNEIIRLEIHRQRDKSNTNSIGYFHQNIFKYIDNCEVPKKGWDIIFTDNNKKIYVEMKNKHNTMNSSSAQKTYIQMQEQIEKDPNNYCYLVEIIARKSGNTPWRCSVNKNICESPHIRRVSIDKFYSIVTGIEDAFYQLCMQLPITINELIVKDKVITPKHDTVIEELTYKNPDMLKALYLLAFETYDGFDKLSP